MIFAILLMDRPGTADLRIEIRPEHRAYLAKLSDRWHLLARLLQRTVKQLWVAY